MLMRTPITRSIVSGSHDAPVRVWTWTPEGWCMRRLRAMTQRAGGGRGGSSAARSIAVSGGNDQRL